MKFKVRLLKVGVFCTCSLLSTLSQANDVLPLDDTLKVEHLKTYNLATTLKGSKDAVSTKAFPASTVLVYNVFTADADGNRDLDYSRFYEVAHIIDFCNLSVKTITAYMNWKVEGAQPWTSQNFRIQIEPQKCHMYFVKKSYQNTDIYLFTGSVIPKGMGQNVLNKDTSKFRVR
ncbi:MAG: hypothetical protein WBP46_10895 [Thiolinea sp.]